MRNILVLALILGASSIGMGLLIGGRFMAVSVANSNDYHGYVVIIDRFTGETRLAPSKNY
jgi:hypothetical protein